MPNSSTLLGYLEDAADEIRAKDGTQATMTVSQMAARIAAIPSGGGGNKLQVNSISLSNTNATSIDLSPLQFVSATAITAACSNCRQLTSFTFGSAEGVSNITAINSLFSGCRAIQRIDLSNISLNP